MIYNENVTDIHKVHDSLNYASPSIKFALETENNHNINFLDISINHQDNHFTFNIYRKPTTTDIIIPADSCHPPEQKYAAIRYMVNRMNSYSLNHSDKIIEQQIIEQIAVANGYNASTDQQINNTKKRKRNTTDKKNRWATFTYYGKETRTITKLFKKTELKIAYKTNNTIGQHLKINTNTRKPELQYKKSGIYSLTCPDCQMKYIGQTGRSFYKRYKEHFHDYKYNIKKSSFATHLLDHNHSIGPINEIMTILYTTKKGTLMDTMEKLHIYNESKIEQSNQR